MIEKNRNSNAIIIGGGPAGLMAAEFLVEQGQMVEVYDAKPAVLRKFLVAGKGGLNLTRNEDFNIFLSHYGNRIKELGPFLQIFGPTQMREWVKNLGFETFTGSSGKVFPEDMQAVALRRSWVKRLKQKGVQFHLNQRWLGWDQEKNLIFQTQSGIVIAQAKAVVLALGGASWPKTGSDGTWVNIFQKQGIVISPLKPANCGFEVAWSAHFRDRFQGSPLKSVVLHFQPSHGKHTQQLGEFLITHYGVEGSLIYAFSAAIRDEILENGKALIHLDLTPDKTVEQLAARLARPRGSRSVSSHLEKCIGIRGVKAGLLWEYLPRSHFDDPHQLAAAIKSLAIPIIAPRPIEEAISTAGGVRFEDLDEYLMLKKFPGIFCAGEMLDWEAPTGGYLLTACFATGLAAAQGVLNWLN